MKKFYLNMTNLLVGMMLCAIGLLLLTALFGCSKKVVVPNPHPWLGAVDIGNDSTWYRISWVDLEDSIWHRISLAVGDTIILPGEYIEVVDSVDCPPELQDSTPVTLMHKVYVPGKTMVITGYEYDTVYLPKREIALPIKTITKDMSWPERITWGIGVITLLIGLWKSLKQHHNENQPT